MQGVAIEQKIGFANLFEITRQAMSSPGEDLTVNGIHLNDQGYELFSAALFKEVFRESAPKVKENIRTMVVEKDRQYLRRYRPLNTFYYTGGRKGQ